MAKIYLDPGHGGHDPGAIGKKSNEKTNVLKVAKEIKKLLEKQGHTVRLSRSTDKFVILSERAADANNWGADIFASLHNNAAVSTASGFETFVYSGSISDRTKKLQKAVHNAIANKIGINNRGTKSANFAVLRQSKMSAMLIEYAFITNTEDEKILTTKINALAQWTADGISDFYGGKASKPTPVTKPKASAPQKKPAKRKEATGKYATIQKMLNSRYGFKLAVDNIPGSATKRALVRAYQTELNVQFNAGLVVDGLWGPKTRNASVTVRKGAKGNLTRLLQAALIIKGYNVGKSGADGIFGDATYKAVRSYQSKNGLTVDGTPGKATFAKLLA